MPRISYSRSTELNVTVNSSSEPSSELISAGWKWEWCAGCLEVFPSSLKKNQLSKHTQESSQHQRRNTHVLYSNLVSKPNTHKSVVPQWGVDISTSAICSQDMGTRCHTQNAAAYSHKREENRMERDLSVVMMNAFFCLQHLYTFNLFLFSSPSCISYLSPSFSFFFLLFCFLNQRNLCFYISVSAFLSPSHANA